MPDTSNSPSETAAAATSTSRAACVARVFSRPVMCMFVLAAVIFRYCPRGLAEPDIWWHLRNAAYLFQHHSFPRVDTYSFGAAGLPRLNYEWLSEIPFLLGFDAGGYLLRSQSGCWQQ